MGRDEMREIEPHVGGVAALRVPQEGIVDYPKVCAALVAKLQAARDEGRDRTRGSPACARTAPDGWPKPRRAPSPATSSSTAPACIATASRSWPASAATCASCPSAANITRSARSGSHWSGI